jgi:hypothetical protein
MDSDQKPEGNSTMRFMMMYKPDKHAEAGIPPNKEHLKVPGEGECEVRQVSEAMDFAQENETA